ncbi:MAG: hypothetical protein AB1650_06230 [Candidatus Omnitrophota bacterium]
MRHKKSVIFLYEQMSVVAILILLGLIFFVMTFRVMKRVKTVEAITNIGTLGASLERCSLMQGAYAACQGGFFWEGHWNLDVNDPNDSPNAYFEYGVWADNHDWVVAARIKGYKESMVRRSPFVAMSSYSNGEILFCGFDRDDELCDELRIIIPCANFNSSRN